jgi:membrane protein DedA with SNARE-associated domain
MEPLAVAGIVALLLVKESGVPIPVPGDLVVIGTGAALAADPFGGLLALGSILLAGYAGGTLQFALVRGAVRRPFLRLLARLGVGEARIESLAARLRRSGARGVAVSRMTPGVRVGSIAASAIAGIPLSTFVRGLVAGNTVFVAGHFGLGFALGASAGAIIGQASSLALVTLAVVAALAAVGAVGWLLIRRARARRGVGAVSAVAVAWADAACPACLALAIVGPDGHPSIPATVGQDRRASGAAD